MSRGTTAPASSLAAEATLVRFARALAAPGTAPWLTAASLVASAAVELTASRTSALAAPLLATAPLLLATGRAWSPRRDLCERIGIAAALLLLGLLLSSRLDPPWSFALLPPLALGILLGVLSATAWRFEPDIGQSDRAWAVRAALPRLLGPGLALGLVLPWVIAWLEASPRSSGPVVLLSLFAVLGHIAQTRLRTLTGNSPVRRSPLEPSEAPKREWN